jgi:hypothetical protein
VPALLPPTEEGGAARDSVRIKPLRAIAVCRPWVITGPIAKRFTETLEGGMKPIIALSVKIPDGDRCSAP